MTPYRDRVLHAICTDLAPTMAPGEHETDCPQYVYVLGGAMTVPSRPLISPAGHLIDPMSFGAI